MVLTILQVTQWQSSFSKINFFMCKNKGKFIVFEKLDCQLAILIIKIKIKDNHAFIF
jgi:hypothetical protein